MGITCRICVNRASDGGGILQPGLLVRNPIGKGTDVMNNQTYTVGDLLALDNDALNAMAAELRGIHRAVGGGGWIEDGTEAFYDEIFLPATDRNQSGELLVWAIEQGCQFDISLTAESEIDFCASGGDWSTISIDSGLPRAETIAFCAAMLAMKERLAQ